jgi:hypothetical protein
VESESCSKIGAAGEGLPRPGAGTRAGILYEAYTICIDYIRKVGL